MNYNDPRLWALSRTPAGRKPQRWPIRSRFQTAAPELWAGRTFTVAAWGSKLPIEESTKIRSDSNASSLIGTTAGSALSYTSDIRSDFGAGRRMYDPNQGTAIFIFSTSDNSQNQGFCYESDGTESGVDGFGDGSTNPLEIHGGILGSNQSFSFTFQDNGSGTVTRLDFTTVVTNNELHIAVVTWESAGSFSGSLASFSGEFIESISSSLPTSVGKANTVRLLSDVGDASAGRHFRGKLALFHTTSEKFDDGVVLRRILSDPFALIRPADTLWTPQDVGGGTTVDVSAGFAASAGLSASALGTFEGAATLAANMALSSSATANLEGTAQLALSSGLTASALATFEAQTTYPAQAGLLASVGADIDVAGSLGAQAAISAFGGQHTDLAASIAASAGVSAGAVIAQDIAATLVASAGLSAAATAVVEGQATYPVSQGLTSQSQAVFEGTITLNADADVSAAVETTVDVEVSVDMAAGMESEAAAIHEAAAQINAALAMTAEAALVGELTPSTARTLTVPRQGRTLTIKAQSRTKQV